MEDEKRADALPLSARGALQTGHALCSYTGMAVPPPDTTVLDAHLVMRSEDTWPCMS